jgi:hypothetical protein
MIDELDELERAGQIAHGAYSIASHALRDKRRSAPSGARESSRSNDGQASRDDRRDMARAHALPGARRARTGVV